MEAGRDRKAEINPAARHDAPGQKDRTRERSRREDEQVKPKQDAELNPLDPGGIGD